MAKKKAPAATNGHAEVTPEELNTLPRYAGDIDLAAREFNQQIPTGIPRELLTPGDDPEDLPMRTFVWPEEHRDQVMLFALGKILSSGGCTIEKVQRFDLLLRVSWWGRSRELTADMYTHIRTAQTGPVDWAKRLLRLGDSPKEAEGKAK